MRPWQFSKPKNPGFGISKGTYLTVLCSSAILPSIRQVVNPEGERGAAIGFGVPLAQTGSKEDLNLPLTRGIYAVATKDRKTVMRMRFLPKEEAGYDPEAFARSSMAIGADPELLARVRATWNLAQFTFESHDAMVYPAMDFLLGICSRLASLTDGVIADPISRRYLLPHQVFVADRMDLRVDARDHVSVQFANRPEGAQAYTLGMQKFALPEAEIFGIAESDLDVARRFLLAMSQRVLLGDLTRPGDRFGAPKFAFEARDWGLDRAMWEGIPVVELLPPTGKTPGECLRAWEEASRTAK